MSTTPTYSNDAAPFTPEMIERVEHALRNPNPAVLKFVTNMLGTVATGDHAGLSAVENYRVYFHVYNTIEELTKAGPDAVQADADRLWGRLSATDKQTMATTPGAVAGIVNQTIASDPVLASRLPGASGIAPAAAGDSASAGFFDNQGRNPFDRMIAGNRIAGFAGGSTNYTGIAGIVDDPKKLTPENFSSSPFMKAGLDLKTTLDLALQGFGPQAILHAAALSRALGINVNAHVGAVARLTRDVKGIDASLRTIKSLSDEVDAQREEARQARERGDHGVAAEHEKKAEEARKQRTELETRERERIRTSHPDKPGLVNDFDNTATAIKGKGAQIDADLKAGRITQEQADAQLKARAEQTRATRTAKLTADAQAESAAAANPAAGPAKREAEISQTVAQVVQPQGREAARAEAADLLSGDTAAPGPQAAQASNPSPTVSAPAQETQAAAAKPAEDSKKKGNTPSLG